MPILDLYSKRQKRKRGEIPDVYQYEDIRPEFRVQVVHILRDALGVPKQWDATVQRMFKLIHDVLCREYGLLYLNEHGQRGDYVTAVYEYLLHVSDTVKVLDVIEVCFKGVDGIETDGIYRRDAEPQITAQEAREELNARFLEHGIGYQYESGKIIRIDSKFIHREAIQPALGILSDGIYAGANQEFLKAFEHYRHGRYKECLNECLKSFESTLKVICRKHKWKYDDADTAKKLLEICFNNSLIPPYLESHFSSLRAGLESGVPTLRNKLSGHGQGSQPTDVPAYFASYALNLTATSILFLAEAERQLP